MLGTRPAWWRLKGAMSMASACMRPWLGRRLGRRLGRQRNEISTEFQGAKIPQEPTRISMWSPDKTLSPCGGGQEL
jgi:hypothetical protein